MRAICRDDRPFARHSWKREDAIADSDRLGQQDNVRLLQGRPHAFFEMYECGGMYEYFYGDMLPSTGYLRAFALLRREPGLCAANARAFRSRNARALCRAPADDAAPSHRERGAGSTCWNARTPPTSTRWSASATCAEFIRVNEALQEKSIAAIADQIAEVGMRAWCFVAGPSSSGKTTFTNRLAVQLRVNHLRPLMLSLDNYYRPLVEVPRDEDGKPDLEMPSKRSTCRC